MRPDAVGLGGFDSHAFPPRIPRWLRVVVIAVVCVTASHAVSAQGLPKPPISPRRAFITSALVPGLAQAKLRRSTGILFSTVEAIGLAMYSKAHHDLSVARRFGRDSTPLTYVIDPQTGLPERDENGALKVESYAPRRFSEGRINARKTHVEDWAAVLIFNHLFAGIDGYVAAQLWQLPTEVELRALPHGVQLQARVKW